MVEFNLYNITSLGISAFAFLIASFLHIAKYIDSIFSPTKSSSSRKVDAHGNFLGMRTFLWAQQALFFSLVSLSVLRYILGYSAESDLLVGFSKSLVGFSLVLSFYDDDLDSIHDKRKKKKWLVVYVLVFSFQVVNSISHCDAFSILSTVCSGLGLFSAFIEYFHVNKYRQNNIPTREYTCGMIEYLSFSMVQPIIKAAMEKNTLDIDDIPVLADADSCENVWARLSVEIFRRKRKHNGMLSYPDLIASLFMVVRYEWYIQGFFAFCAAITGYLSPIALQRVLRHVSGGDSVSEDSGEVSSYDVSSSSGAAAAGAGIEKYISLEVALLFLFIGPLLKGTCDGQNYSRGRHIGLQIKGGLLSAIFHKSTVTNLAATKDDVGSVNNLISVDVGAIQEFMCYSHLMWSCVLEVLLCVALLIMVLGHAALAGLGVLVFTVPLVYFVSANLNTFQEEMLAHKDKRMATVSEILNGIRIIKMFAWEDSFLDKLYVSRSSELNSLRKYAILDGVQKIVWDTVPIIIAISSFLVHTLVLHKTLTPAIGFTALTLFDRLRLPITWIPEV
jgi:ABC-type multidrug transport system fused ATPase/permease subunit